MLTRAFRVTDRLGNALLRISAWSALAMTAQVAQLKNGILGVIVSTWQLIFGSITLAIGMVLGTARHTSHSAQQAYEVTQDVADASSRRQARMAQRAMEMEMKPTIVKDPLLAQNRALSAVAVLLLILLVFVVVLETNEDPNTPVAPGGIIQWPQGAETPIPTALFPTPTATATPIPDPLRVGGSIVYTLRENGQTDLWAFSVNESGPIRLTNSPADERDPAWSPDGRRIAFASNQEGNWELYILALDSGFTTRLTYSQGFEGAPTWSPDGNWLAYEGYYPDREDLDIYLISSDPATAAAQGSYLVTSTPGPDTEPAWIPGAGRDIAFTSWRAGSKDIFVVNLDGEGDARAVNVTNTPDIQEDYAAWNSDGTRLAYTANVNGIEGIYVKSIDLAAGTSGPATLVGRGKMPGWAPNDGSIVYMLDYGQQTQLLAGSVGGFGAATDAMAFDHRATDPHWANITLPRALINNGGVPISPDAGPLYEENARLQATNLYGMAPLNNVVAPQPYLSDRVNDSFEAMRLRVLEKAGYDFFGTLDDAFWPQNRPPDPGEPRQNWHYAGRAFAINRNLIYAGLPTPIEVVREDSEINTYWRVYLRVTEQAQNGALGEPLRDLPWDFTARSSGDVEYYEQGGRIKATVPPGYYIDLTQLAEDFAWGRIPAQRTWQNVFGAIQFWEFVKTDGLTWEQAMLELYTPGEFQNFLIAETPIPTPPPLPTSSPTPEIFRSPTPIPPDQQ